MLKFDKSWRYDSPGEIPDKIYQEFSEIISKLARGEQRVLEHFKKYFAAASGSTASWSSSASWADSDLQSYMQQASANAPLFIEAFYDALNDLKASDEDLPVPDHQYLNKLLIKHDAKYRIDPPNLILIDPSQAQASAPEIPATLDQRAQELIQQSFHDAQKLLSEGRHRQAVQELLWLLETVSTAFQGMSKGESSSIQGKYFNKIIEELRSANQGTALEQVIGWIRTLHGYLSAPAGGGIRHGMHLKEGIVTSPGEAKLYCNLITSYISFLLAEYERLNTKL